ncbi:BPL/LPL catalytic domain-containing protein [Pseudoscourfieldia marina]
MSELESQPFVIHSAPFGILASSSASSSGPRSSSSSPSSSTNKEQSSSEVLNEMMQPVIDAISADPSQPFFKRINSSSPSTTTTTTTSTFDVNKFASMLTTSSLGRAIATTPVTSSTQDFISAVTQADNNTLKVPLGFVALADLQTKGRGRGNNVWKHDNSANTQLAFTALWQFAGNASALASLQHVVCVAAAQASQALRIKWPNDLYTHAPPTKDTSSLDGTVAARIVTSDGVCQGKAGGVLCTASVASGKRASPPGCAHISVGDAAAVFDVAIGVGINVMPHPPFASLSDAADAGIIKHVSREEVLARLCNELEPLLMRHVVSGFDAEVRSTYTQRWVHDNHVLRVASSLSSSTQPEEVRLENVTESGFLVGRMVRDGSRVELHPDQCSVDLMEGLVVAKRL